MTKTQNKLKIERIKIKHRDSKSGTWCIITWSNKNVFSWYQIVKLLNIFAGFNGEISGNSFVIRKEMKEKVLNKIKSELNIGFTEKSDTKKKNGSTFTSGIGDNLINPKKVKH